MLQSMTHQFVTVSHQQASRIIWGRFFKKGAKVSRCIYFDSSVVYLYDLSLLSRNFFVSRIGLWKEDAARVSEVVFSQETLKNVVVAKVSNRTSCSVFFMH